MIPIIKEICIFMIIAQAVLFFVPGNAYMKYVRILVGIIMIMRITQPLIQFSFNKEEQAKIKESVKSMQEKLEELKPEASGGDEDMGIYTGIEEELQSRLSKCPNEKYAVEKVELVGIKQDLSGGNEIEGIRVTAVPIEKKENHSIEVKVKPICLSQEAYEGNTGGYGNSQCMEKESYNENEIDELRKIYGDFLGMDMERVQVIMSD